MLQCLHTCTCYTHVQLPCNILGIHDPPKKVHPQKTEQNVIYHNSLPKLSRAIAGGKNVIKTYELCVDKARCGCVSLASRGTGQRGGIRPSNGESLPVNVSCAAVRSFNQEIWQSRRRGVMVLYGATWDYAVPPDPNANSSRGLQAIKTPDFSLRIFIAFA